MVKKYMADECVGGSMITHNTEESLLGLSNQKISLMPHTPLWKKEFQVSKEELQNCLPDAEIEHTGSTAIPWIPAKPIIDIAIAAHEPEDKIAEVEGCGYLYMGEKGVPGRFYFVKGLRERRTHHIHMFEKGSEQYAEHIFFRDHLLAHRITAEEYGKLKLRLWRKYSGDRKAYTKAKAKFIQDILEVNRKNL